MANIKKIPFSAWFQRKIKMNHPGLQVHHKDAVWAFFKASGLSENEESAMYDSHLTIYGL